MWIVRASLMAAGSVVIILCGCLWFSFLTRTSPLVAFQFTVLKFIPGDIIKIALAAAVVPTGWKLLDRKH